MAFGMLVPLERLAHLDATLGRELAPAIRATDRQPRRVADVGHDVGLRQVA